MRVYGLGPDLDLSDSLGVVPKFYRKRIRGLPHFASTQNDSPVYFLAMGSRDDLYEALSLAEENDQLATARVLYEEILEGDADNGALLVLYAANLTEIGDFMRAEAILERAEEYVDEEIKPGFLTQRGHLARERGEFETAENFFRAAHKLNVEDGEPLVLAASVAAARGELAKAEYLTREAIRLPETAEEAWFQLGGLFVSQQRYVEAREAYRQVLELDPENGLAKEWMEDLDQVLEMTNK